MILPHSLTGRINIVEEMFVKRDKISTRKLKDFAFSRLPKQWPLREILLAEEDELETSIFLARLPVWLKLSRIPELRKTGNGGL